MSIEERKSIDTYLNGQSDYVTAKTIANRVGIKLKRCRYILRTYFQTNLYKKKLSNRSYYK